MFSILKTGLSHFDYLIVNYVLLQDLTRRLNKYKISKSPYLNALKDALEDWFLAFQVAELEKELKLLEN